MYFYEHVNGETIKKPDIVVAPSPHEYFDSPFVKRWWWFDDAESNDPTLASIMDTSFGGQ